MFWVTISKDAGYTSLSRQILIDRLIFDISRFKRRALKLSLIALLCLQLVSENQFYGERGHL